MLVEIIAIREERVERVGYPCIAWIGTTTWSNIPTVSSVASRTVRLEQNLRNGSLVKMSAN
jgi:hypothetical protein